MIQVMLSNILLLLLTILAAVFSGSGYLMPALGGSLMILITMGAVKEDEGKLLKFLQLSFAFLFAICSGSFWGCIVFVLLPLSAWQLFLMADVALAAQYFLLPLIRNTEPSGQSIGYRIAFLFVLLFVLDMIMLFVVLCRKLLYRISQKREEDRRRILSYGLSEMHEVRRNRELRRQSFYADKNARLIERENISRNIHNSVGHSITAAIMALDAADVLFEKKPEEAHKRMNDAAERIRGSLESIRSAVRALDAEGEDVSVKDLLCYFDNILNEFMMDTERSCDRFYDVYSEEYLLPREHAEFLTGALSELLTNGVKHGGASRFVIKLSADSAHVRLELADNGKNDYDKEKLEDCIRNGFGLKKLASYAERCGGHTDFYEDNGFHSVIELPIAN
ncbi:MAG: hypothetical protein IK115_07465 [Lachnospiraceae bacterium]|nr:hypothetical protein [Lachnospiraceae bacterium]